MIDCGQAEVLIERRLDGEASRQDDAALDGHVATCPACAEWLVRETALDAALAARFTGAVPSAAFAAVVRTRIAAERPAPAAWIPDALNAAGLVVSFLVVLPLSAWWGGAVGAAISVGAVLVGSYPLLLASWAVDAGPGEPDPTS
jgi:predicted anti-sigma-YlaC factor YlaD